MTYFKHSALTKATLARSEFVNALFQSIENSFASIPDASRIVAGTVTYGVESGVANAYVVTLDPAPSAYSEGMTVDFKAGTGNTGASTININGLGVKTIRAFNGEQLVAGQIPTGSIVTVRYDGSVFRINNIVGISVPGDGTITNAKLTTVPGGTVKGRPAGASGSPSDLTATQLAAFMTGQALSPSKVFAGNGAAGAPSISFTNDTNSGFYSSSQNVMAMTLGGALEYSFSAGSTSPLPETAMNREKADARFVRPGDKMSIASGTGQNDPGLYFGDNPDTGFYLSGSGPRITIEGVAALQFDPQGATASQIITAMTREKGDARYALKPYAGSSSANATFAIGEAIAVIDFSGGTFPARNSIVAPRLDGAAATFNIGNAGTLLSGVWRARGLISTNASGVGDPSFLAVRTA